MEINPNTVVHQNTDEEKSFTSTGDKLAYHHPIFKKYSETGYGSIVRATMTNTQSCSSKCSYCSTIHRNKKDSISLEEAKEFVNKLYFDQAEYNKKNFPEYNDLYKEAAGTDIRLKGLILSGGGQPNLWPHFEEFVNWLKDLDIDLGLITNGFPKNVSEDVYKNFKWIRVSITPEDASQHYIGGQFQRQYFPQTIIGNPDITVGFSYVYGEWTTDEILYRIKGAINDLGFDYARLLTDCNLARTAQLKAHQELSERLMSFGFMDTEGNPVTKMFHQFKYHGTDEEATNIWDEGQCFIQSYNVFWDTTGHEENGKSYCYPCDSITVLAEEEHDGNILESERKFNSEKWGTVPNTEVEKLFTEKVKPFFDPRDICKSCLFMKNNAEVKSLTTIRDYSALEINKNLTHVNFP